MKCSYCQTEISSSEIQCPICKTNILELVADMPKIKNIEINDLFKTLNDKKKLHTYNLLQLLRMARKERSDAYNLVKTVRNASEGSEMISIDKSIIEGKKRIERNYEEMTAYVKQIETILMQRLGYYPKRIDNQLLQRYLDKISP